MSYSFSCSIFLLKKEKPRNSRALRNQKGNVEAVGEVKAQHNGH